MCLLSFYPADVTPDTDALSNGAYVNDDGHGFAVVAGKRIIVRRGMDAERMVAEFARIRSKHRSGPALFHSRFGTHGTLTKANCHPFRIGHDSRTVLAHNGILPKSVQPKKGDKRSDTRIAAEDFLPRSPFNLFDSQGARDVLARWLTRSNKIVILTVNPRYRHNAYILHEEHGIWDSGIWYSNSDYRGVDPTWATPAEWESWLAHTEHDQCRTCREVGVIDTITRFCRVCGTCDDCGEEDGHCVCYMPTTLADHAQRRDLAHDTLTG